MKTIQFLPSCNDTHVHGLVQTGAVGGRFKDYNLLWHIVNVCFMGTASVLDQLNFPGCKSSNIRHKDILKLSWKDYMVRPCIFCKKYGTGGIYMRKHLGFITIPITAIGTLSLIAFVWPCLVMRFFDFIDFINSTVRAFSFPYTYVRLGRSLEKSPVLSTLKIHST